MLARPYYRLHQIIAGQYAIVGELVTKDGVDYEGPYHILPNGNLFTDYRPADNSVQLFYKRNDVHPSVSHYNKLKGNSQSVSQYTAPKYYSSAPTAQDYQDGYFYRYFAQKKNAPLSTISEISYADFTEANLSNAPGISLQLYRLISIKWIIARMSDKEASILNSKAVYQAELEFAGITQYLSNLVEFYQEKVV